MATDKNAKVAPMVLTRADLQFQITQVRTDKLIWGIEAIVVSLLTVTTAIFLPELLYRIILAQGMEMDAAFLGWIPAIAYGIGALFTLYTLLANLGRMKQVKKLEKMLAEAKR